MLVCQKLPPMTANDQTTTMLEITGILILIYCSCGDGSRCRRRAATAKKNLRGSVLCRSGQYAPTSGLPHLVAALECKIAGVTHNLRLGTTHNVKGCYSGWIALGITSQGADDINVKTEQLARKRRMLIMATRTASKTFFILPNVQ